MRELLFASCPPMLWVITCLELIFTVLLFCRYTKSKNLIFLLSGLICVGLTYDALVLALGCFTACGGKEKTAEKQQSKYRFDKTVHFIVLHRKRSVKKYLQLQVRQPR